MGPALAEEAPPNLSATGGQAIDREITFPLATSLRPQALETLAVSGVGSLARGDRWEDVFLLRLIASSHATRRYGG